MGINMKGDLKGRKMGINHEARSWRKNGISNKEDGTVLAMKIQRSESAYEENNVERNSVGCPQLFQ